MLSERLCLLATGPTTGLWDIKDDNVWSGESDVNVTKVVMDGRVAILTDFSDAYAIRCAISGRDKSSSVIRR